MKNEFDSLLQEKFDSGSFEYNPQQWNKMNNLLDAQQKPPKTGRKKLWLLLPFSAMAASVAAFTIWSLPATHNDATIQPQQEYHAQATGTTSNTPQEQQPQQAATTHIAYARNAAGAPASATRNTSHIQNTEAYKETATPDTQVQSPAPDNLALHTPDTRNDQPKKKDFSYDYYDHTDAAPTRNNYTSLSLAGGVNYGSLNTGYMVGVNARQKISGSLYVEGDLALVNNNSSQMITSSYSTYNSPGGDPNGHPLGTAAGNVAPPETTKKPTALFYLQATPSLGCYVTKGVTLSLGADIQRLLQDDHEGTLIYDGTVNKVAPNMDYGLIGKTEFTVTKKLKAGLMYREGVNNLVRNSTRYFDRSYLQVQLKYRIFGN